MTELSKSLNEELGVAANKVLADKLASEMSTEWKLKEPFSRNPVVLAIGGFQGSGKTTVVEALRRNLDFIEISPDEIRKRLFSLGLGLSEEFIHTVNATRNNLLRMALFTGANVVIDQLTNRDRLDLFDRVASEFKNYRVIRILLLAEKSVLERRVMERKPIEGKYNGTLAELHASMKREGEPNLGLYDRVFYTERLKAMEVAEDIKKLLQV